jgi:hypothetical protein
MAAESKKFKVKDSNTIYTLEGLRNGEYHITWTNSSGEHRNAFHSQNTVMNCFSSGVWYYIDDHTTKDQPYTIKETDKKSALDKQVSGNHYKDCGIQPIEYIHANNLNYFEGNAVKYITRHRKKNGKADIEKAIHYLELMLELEYKDETV